MYISVAQYVIKENRKYNEKHDKILHLKTKKLDIYFKIGKICYA